MMACRAFSPILFLLKESFRLVYRLKRAVTCLVGRFDKEKNPELF